MADVLAKRTRRWPLCIFGPLAAIGARHALSIRWQLPGIHSGVGAEAPVVDPWTRVGILRRAIHPRDRRSSKCLRPILRDLPLHELTMTSTTESAVAHATP